MTDHSKIVAPEKATPATQPDRENGGAGARSVRLSGVGPRRSADRRPAQLPLFEPASVPSFQRTNFITEGSHAEIVPALESWLIADQPCLIITGPAGSGKTHLVHLMAEFPGCPALQFLGADGVDAALGSADAPAIRIVDSMETAPLGPRAMIGLIEASQQGPTRLVLSGRSPVADWAQGLRDLHTRLQAIPRLQIPDPDETVLRGVIIRQLRARQLALSPEQLDSLASYAAPRLERTFEAAAQFVERLDLLALQTGRKPSISLARQCLGGPDEQT